MLLLFLPAALYTAVMCDIAIAQNLRPRHHSRLLGGQSALDETTRSKHPRDSSRVKALIGNSFMLPCAGLADSEKREKNGLRTRSWLGFS
jgi:hypothetical protein